MSKASKVLDIEYISQKFDDLIGREFAKPNAADVARYEPLVREILDAGRVLSDRELNALQRKHRFNGKRSFLFQVYLTLTLTLSMSNVTVTVNVNEEYLRKTLQIKPCKSWSGLVTITIFTAAHPEFTNSAGERVVQSFSCAYNCAFCPNEPGQPRSYLKGEPGVMRANKNSFDCVGQVRDRMKALYLTGHNPLKCDIIVSGGTWTSYPKEYREEFCRDMYFAINTFWDWFNGCDKDRQRLAFALANEKRINETARSRVVGLTIETRPDTVNAEEIRLMRAYGVTRVQMGIQHTNDAILDKVNRRCSTDVTRAAIKLLKQNCYKISAHWMPNLPGSTAEMDDNMLNYELLGLKQPVTHWTMGLPPPIKAADGECRESRESRESRKSKQVSWSEWKLAAPDLSCDSWKIYPTAITPWTDIAKWYHEGTYVPYPERDLMNVLARTMALMYPWIRLERVIRDIPECYMYNEDIGADNTNMRQELDDVLKTDGVYCMDIRNREVKNRAWDGEFTYVVRKFGASGGTEYFVSAESEDNKTLYGFVRLRLDNAMSEKVFAELLGCALVREVHVYGDLTQVSASAHHVQHRGIGRKLMAFAESIAVENGYKKAAVIAAEGNKEYYRKLGYGERGLFMVKLLYSQ